MDPTTWNWSDFGIRPFRQDDADDLQRHASDRRVSIQLRDRFPYPYTQQDAETFIDMALSHDPVRTYAIVDAQDRVIGAIGVQLGSDVHRLTAELGYWIGVEYWGRGVTTRAVAAFAPAMLERHGLRRIFAMPFSNNPASIRVLEKAGFKYEGRLSQHAIKEGRLLDMLLYAWVADTPFDDPSRQT